MSTLAARRRAQERFRERHPGNGAERSRRWRAAHPAESKAQSASYRSKPEAKTKKLERQRRWQRENPERVSFYCLRYQRRKRTRQGDQALLAEYRTILLKDPCSYCGHSADTEDHIVPVSAGGADDWENLTAACRSCNSRKQARSLLRFLLDAEFHTAKVYAPAAGAAS